MTTSTGCSPFQRLQAQRDGGVGARANGRRHLAAVVSVPPASYRRPENTRLDPTGTSRLPLATPSTTGRLKTSGSSMPGPVTSTTSVAAEMEATAFSARRACPGERPRLHGRVDAPGEQQKQRAQQGARKNVSHPALLLDGKIGRGRDAAERRRDARGFRRAWAVTTPVELTEARVGTLDAQAIWGLAMAVPFSLAVAVKVLVPPAASVVAPGVSVTVTAAHRHGDGGAGG